MIPTQNKTNGQSIKTPGQNLDALFESVESYGKVKFELIKLQSLQAVTRVSASLVFRLTLCALAFLFVLMLSTGIAFWIGDALGKMHFGFLIVAGFYLLVLLLFPVLFKTGLRKWVSGFIIREVLQ